MGEIKITINDENGNLSMGIIAIAIAIVLCSMSSCQSKETIARYEYKAQVIIEKIKHEIPLEEDEINELH